MPWPAAHHQSCAVSESGPRPLPKPAPIVARAVWTLAALLLLVACGAGAPQAPDLFPAAQAIPGWSVSEEVTTFDHETIYSLVNGQADAFFAYGFERVGAQSYTNADGAVLRMLVWQVETPADAFGLFTANAADSRYAIGNDGEMDPGRRVAFWQDRYYVQISTLQPVAEADLVSFAEAAAAALPAGGSRPGLVAQLPDAGLVAESVRFFHEEISIQSELWLGGENRLGLGRETDGALARYELADQVTVQLLLVQYPDEQAAADGLAALRSGEVGDVLAADTRGALLGAVFGTAAEDMANTLLQEALE